MIYSAPVPPKPTAPSDIDERRWAASAFRRRLLTGLWEQDLEEMLLAHLPTDRREALGVSDMSSNVFEQVTRQLSVLYFSAPQVAHDGDISALVGRDGYVTKSGYFQLMQRVQQMTLGIREMFVRVDVSPNIPQGHARIPGLSFRAVTPDYVLATASEDAPDIPLYYQELRLRMNPDSPDEPIWTWDIFDIRDPNNPLYGVFEASPSGGIGADLSNQYMGHDTLRGDAYPYRSKTGEPFLPLVLFHAEKTGQLFNPFDMSTLPIGSLNASCLYSFFVHCVRDNSWPQKYAVGVNVQGLTQLEGDLLGRRSAISTDPSSILMFQPDADMTGQPLIGSFSYADPQKLLESISAYEYRIATAAGISSEVLRQSGDPRSGYALSISREGQRNSSIRLAPQFRIADSNMMSVCAMLCNRFLGTSLPELGYRIKYNSLPLSPEERKSVREDVLAKLEAGLISPVDALKILNPDLDDLEARRELERIRKERAEFSL
tara:strand:- start:7814 stop:9280 length:1467 start_codon:yes stop_codon:yes gene_type:complete